MAKIPHDTIEEVRARTDIVDVVSDYVKLKKRGSNFVGLCPFHKEKTPSFNVNPAREIYKCFGCGVGGDVFNFVTEIEGLSFPEAVRSLAERVGVVIPEAEEPSEAASETEAVYHALRFAAKHFFDNLTKSDSAAQARTYLKERGVTSESVKKFGLGFAQNRWDALVAEAETGHIDIEMLEKAGLVIARKESDGHYDRYRNRIVFPIVSHVGKILGFGGRVVDSADEPKYINSPETTVYNKSRVLYGMYHARQDIRAREEVLLVEGYMDVVALHQNGITNVVATCGTALAEGQVQLLSRYARRIVLLYDSDLAGVRAAVRAIDIILEKGLSAYAVGLPEGEDPDSFIAARGRDGFEAYLDGERQDFVHFVLSQARRSGKLQTPEGTADVQRSVLRSISKIPDPLMRESYIRLGSDALDIPDIELRRILNSLSRKKKASSTAGAQPTRRRTQPSQSPAAGQPAVSQAILPEEKTLLRLMLEEGPPLIELILSHTALSDFTSGPPRKLASHLVEMFENDTFDRNAFVTGSYGDELRELSAELLTADIEPSENWERRRNISIPRRDENAEEAAKSAMTLLKLDRIDEAISDQKDRIFQAEQAGDDIRDLQKKMIELHEARKLVAERKFISGVQ